MEKNSKVFLGFYPTNPPDLLWVPHDLGLVRASTHIMPLMQLMRRGLASGDMDPFTVANPGTRTLGLE